ncbi:glycosyltransferase [Williamsia deligens]|uniref:Glycosyltransferase n=1 Tax=Williamsia deligens TaxID=321325 RepID=A0ABW3G3E2_9NOCA|nr:glycosyltransferase [Williamsia deligens]
MVTFLLSENSRLAFGSPAAAANYSRFVRRLPTNIEVKQVLELPGPCKCGPLFKTPSLLFVGEFAARKGTFQLMALWDAIEAILAESRDADNLQLVLIGKGELEPTVRAWCSGRARVRLVVDPPRSLIHAHLRRSKALILLSQSNARWREQTGLPVGEGPSHGCRIISTDQIGFADWLKEHGHEIVQQDFDVYKLARRTVEVLSAAEDPDAIVHSLPQRDARLEVDQWLRHT